MLTVILAVLATSVQPAGPSPQPSAEPATLRGPVVAAHVDRVTLVSYDFNSRVRRPETSPEHAAVMLLKLAEEEQKKVDAVFAHRAEMLDRFVSENLMMLGELDTAHKAGDKLGELALLMDAFRKLNPMLSEGQLRDQVAAALPRAQGEEFRRIIGEYWKAIVDEGVRDSRAAGKKEARWQIDLWQRFEHLGKEIERSYERQAASGTLIVDYFLADLDLTAEQRATIQGLKVDMLQRTSFRPSEKDQQLLAVGALAYLNESQRAIVIKRITGKK